MKLQAVDKAVTNEDREWQLRTNRLALDSLDGVRAVAGRWATTIGSLTGVFGLVVLVGGPRSVDSLSPLWRTLVGVSVLLALAMAGGAAWCAAAAAQGRIATALSTYVRVREYHRSEEKRALRLLHISKSLTVAAMAMLLLALGLSWFAPKEDSEVLVIQQGGRTHCIPLKDGMTLSLAIDASSTVTVRRKCPAG